jgi:hypothetical protein
MFIIARVAIIGGIFIIPIENALIEPHTIAINIAHTQASIQFVPLFINDAAIHAVNAHTPPVDISIPPVIITIVIPIAVIPCNEMFCKMFIIFFILRKYGDAIGITMRNAKIIANLIISSPNIDFSLFIFCCIYKTSTIHYNF